MPVFKCRVGERDGRVTERKIEASDIGGLKESLESDGLLVYDISKKGFGLPSFEIILRGGKVNTAEFIVFNQELAALLKAGLPLVSSLETLAEKEENSYFKDILGTIIKEVKEGATLSNAMEGSSKVFTNLYVSSIKAGEKSGDLVTNIKRYIGYAKKVEELKKKIKNASIYPLILLIFALIVIFGLLFFVVPSFSQIFLDNGTALPVPTLILIAITDFIQNNIFILIVLFLLLNLLFPLARKNPKLSRFMALLKLSFPWIGDTIRKYSVAKFSRTLATILKSGEPLVSAISLAAGTLDNVYLEEKIISVSNKVKEGESLSGAMEETGLMPATALKMVLVGESSGALDDMFENVAELFEEEVDRRITFLASTIEPLLMIGMGLVIALIVLAMYLPIFKLAGNVG